MDVVRADTVEEVERLLDIGVRVIVASDFDGGLTVWVDDEGRHRSSFGRNGHKLVEEGPMTEDAVLRWVEEWWPKMGRFHDA